MELGSGTGLVGMLVSKLMTDNDDDYHDNDNEGDDKETTTSTTTTDSSSSSSSSSSSRSVIILTDGDEEAIRLLHQNLADPWNKIDSSRVKATFLRWNEQLDVFDDWLCRQSSISTLTPTETPTVAAASHASIDDNNDDDGGDDGTAMTLPRRKNIEFDIILAGDVMYKQELPLLFFQTAARYLKANSGELWLCHVPRSTVTHQVVMDAAVAMGFTILAVDTKHLLEQITDCPREDLDRAVVYRITRTML